MELITLSNGLRICLDHRPWFASCSLGLYIASGSRFETPETLGVSHFIEHMLFKGTDSLSARRIAEISDDLGGTLNAYTAKEYTCLYARVLTSHIEKMFSMICDMVLHPSLEKRDIDTEKGVIQEERASYEDSTEDLCMDTFYDKFWFPDMLSQNIVGTKETIDSMTDETLRRHMQKFYVPERMVAVFSGAFDREAVLESCEKLLGALPNAGNPLTYAPVKSNTFIHTVPKPVQQNVITLGLPGLPLEDDRCHALTFAMNILGGSGSSRLFQKIREDLGLCYSVDAFHTAYLGAGALCISMGLSAKHEMQALSEIRSILKAFPDSVSAEELERAKMQSIAAVTMALESTDAAASRIGRNVLLRGEVMPQEQLFENLRKVTLDEVKALSGEYLLPDRLSICAVGKVKRRSNYEIILWE